MKYLQKWHGRKIMKKCNITSAVLLVLLFSLTGCKSLLDKLFMEPMTSPHLEVSHWHDYQTIFGNYIINYKIPSSDEYPEKRKGFVNKDGFTSPDNYVPQINRKRGVPFEILMDKNYSTPQYKLSLWIEDDLDHTYIAEYIKKFRRNYTTQKVKVNGRVWFKITQYYTSAKKVIEIEDYFTRLSDTHLLEFVAVYGKTFSTRFKESPRWLKERLEVTQNVLNSINFEKRSLKPSHAEE